MYTYPPSPTPGRIFPDVSSRVPYPYPCLVEADAPIEVEELQAGSVRLRVPFVSPRARVTPYGGTAGRVGDWYTASDVCFDVFFTLPVRTLATPGAQFDHLLVMFNGLNEIMPQHSQLYDWLGHALAERGIASVLLPSPFHLNRTPQSAVPKASLGAMLKKPTNTTNVVAPYLNFFRSMQEVTHLVEAFVRGDAGPQHLGLFGRFSAATKVSLFGFSMGGLRALATFLHDDNEYFDKCIMLCSGATLPDLSPPDVGRDEWLAFVERVREVTPRDLHPYGGINGDSDTIHHALWELFFDDKFGRLGRRIRDRSGRIAAMVGTADVAVSEGARKRLGTHCRLETVPGMNHLVMSDPHFELKFPSFVDGVATFLTSGRYGAMPVTKYDVRDRLLTHARREFIYKSRLTVEGLRDLAKRSSAVAELLLLSKARYATDSVLVDHLERYWERGMPTSPAVGADPGITHLSDIFVRLKSQFRLVTGSSLIIAGGAREAIRRKARKRSLDELHMELEQRVGEEVRRLRLLGNGEPVGTLRITVEGPKRALVFRHQARRPGATG